MLPQGDPGPFVGHGGVAVRTQGALSAKKCEWWKSAVKAQSSVNAGSQKAFRGSGYLQPPNRAGMFTAAFSAIYGDFGQIRANR
jgi:hypothetical protein